MAVGGQQVLGHRHRQGSKWEAVEGLSVQPSVPKSLPLTIHGGL